MNQIKTLWEFSRPHTIIGSFLSIVCLYLISLAIAFGNEASGEIWKYSNILLLTLISAIGCNVYITGLNQIQDIEIDKINKPWLPIAAGNLSIKKAVIVVSVAAAVSLIAAALTNYILLILIAIIMLIGTAYSLPPLKFKRHHIAAAFSILLVRGLLVNVGMPIQFLYAFNKTFVLPPDVWPLTFFVVGFSLAIAWFKDIPDTEGDTRYSIKTLAISLSPKTAFRYGVAVVSLSYVGLLLLAAFLNIRVNQLFFFAGHSILLLLFWAGSARVQLENPDKLKRFYMLFWGFFFAEYLLYALSYYLL
jgi:homogentisate phytyltransferase / homogentisate geranylgeranyltransferase